jgi:uncharacterized surface anchored protein
MSYSSGYKLFVGDGIQNMIVPGTTDPVTASITINSYYGSVEIEKTDSETGTAQGQATLQGAKYGIYEQSTGKFVATLITDKNGYAKSDKILTYQNYYIQEITPSEGYKLDSTKYYVEIKEESLESTVQVKEDVIKGKIKVTKFDSDTNACKTQGEATLSGAKYKVLNSNGEVVDTLTIGDNCTATTKSLPYGNYRVVEESSSVGYYLDTNSYSVFINNESVFNVISKEQVIKGKIKINKVDSDTNVCKAQGQATLKGAVYEILDLKGNVVDTLTIGDDCTATTKSLPYAHYKIREKTQSKGYYIDTNIYNVNIIEDNVINITSKEQVIKNYISILKQYDGNTTLINAEKGITFEIYYPNGNKFDEITTDKNGYAAINLPYGVWKFHQVNTTTGYEKIYDFYITVDENSEKEQYYNILNNKLAAYLQIYKKDSETNEIISLANTSFKILNIDTNTYVSQYVGGKVYSTFYTDETGKATTYLKLEAGNYKIIELTSPTGYLIDSNGIDFTIGDDTYYYYTTYGIFSSIDYFNNPIKGQVEIYKSGENFEVNNNNYNFSKISLSNIYYGVYAKEDITSSDKKFLYYQKDELVDTLITSDSGYATSKLIPLGNYYIKEIKTNDSYIIDNQVYDFSIKEIDNRTPVVKINFEFYNNLKKGKLIFIKKDKENKELIPNTEIEVYTVKDELIFIGSTDSNGSIEIDNLPIGNYYLKETKPASGYITNNEKIYFEIKDNDEIIYVEMQNKKIKGAVQFYKVDFTNNVLLEGACIEIYDLENHLFGTYITSKEGKVIVDNIPYGKYYIIEKIPPTGYKINNEKIYFEINKNEEVITIKMKDKKIKSIVTIKKTDNDFKLLEGVEIGIFNLDGNLIYKGVTDLNGTIAVELEYGSYYYQEIKTIDELILDYQKYYFDVVDCENLEFTLINEREEIVIPNTLKNENYLLEILTFIILIFNIIGKCYVKR